ncbi:MAG: SUMF1/EgtB/PvdO family nonheme iron enzyme [Kiritimatiellae bacterium]|nr:SUMF1/EgtB/PvdO family nonheme iron enzyme [Kiritimatiellia bacterium]MDD5522006.1 SUMF1/EgtB/PvdO family nonheme iron enzyme [Kiritimatiellia bacterium]
MKTKSPVILILISFLIFYIFASAADPAPNPEVLQGTTSLRLAIKDLSDTFQGSYPKGKEFLKRVDDLENQAKTASPEKKKEILIDFEKLKSEATLSNPLLNFDKLLLIKRTKKRLGLPQNWQGNCAISKTGYSNEIAILSPVSPEGTLSTFFKPEKDVFVGDVDLHFDADKMLFSMPGTSNLWQIWEIQADGKGLRQVTTGEEPDVENYDPCYLPNGKIIFDSTRCFAGVPCVGGGNNVANLCIMDADGSNVRMLCFDQEHNWCPTVMNDGRVLYSRWEYMDTPHYFTRLLFRMNPDGTGQMEYYASNSYWPNSIFYARPIPNHPTMVVAVISGHHGVPRMGELILFDPARGRHESDGVVQRIPGYGKEVQPVIADALVQNSWPKFLHPYPLSEKYLIVSAQLTPESLWGIYLVDIFDNMTLIKELPEYALLEPLPFRKTPIPPVIPPRINMSSREATVYLSDIYRGQGLVNIPRGKVKSLRIFEPHYAYPRMGGHIDIGIDGPWDVHRIYGTVPVNEDGSAVFIVPANIPFAVQPLDAEGKALQIMRSWFTAMPGEVLSCVGCHERQNVTAPSKATIAYVSQPKNITPWFGPDRGFSFKREVQPVLDRYCAGCHNSETETIGDNKRSADGREIPNFRSDQVNEVAIGKPNPAKKIKQRFKNFVASYVALHPYLRRPGPENDYHIQVPMEFHADTSELVQMLRKGHHNVKLDPESWDRLITWIDLNVPDHGTWGEQRQIAANYHERRLEMRTKYANRPEDPETIPSTSTNHVTFIKPDPEPERKQEKIECAGWPFDATEAKKRQEAFPKKPEDLRIDLGGGIVMELVAIPSGEFIIGDSNASPDEYPRACVKITKPFLMTKFEVSNEIFGIFDPNHDTAYISAVNKDQSNRGHPINGPKQPVSRVSWQEANEFCKWLSVKTGRKFKLPTEAQWEWACRAGTATPFYYGDYNSDFSKFANLADQTIAKLARANSPPWHPKDDRFNDGAMVTSDVGRYQPNTWGLHDIHGNAAEWTRSLFKAYPYNEDDGRNDISAQGKRVVRGGSWFDRPYRASSAYRLAYEPYQKVYNVGLRLVCEE